MRTSLLEILPPDVPKKGIVVMHGIGAAQQSSTLLDIGQPLFTFVKRWMEAQGRPVHTIEADLSFATFDDGGPDSKPHAGLLAGSASDHDEQVVWFMAEAWWAQSFRQPGFPVMCQWAWRHWRLVLFNLASIFWIRQQRVLPGPSRTDPPWPARLVDAVNNVWVLALLWMGFPLGVVLFGILFAAAQIPIKPLQEFIVVRLLQPFLVINIGQFRAFLDDEIQAANMRRRFEAALQYLSDELKCEELYVIAHSGGVPIVFDALSRPENREVAEKVRKVFSIGQGLNKAWEIDPNEPRLKGPLRSDVRWIDFHASYDPVPAGPLGPERYGVKWPKDFEPNEITHRMDLLTDHGGYWLNDEQVLWRIAQEIDREDHKLSQFYGDDSIRLEAVKSLRTRVSLLVGLRLLAAAIFVAILAAKADQVGGIGGVGAWGWSLAQLIPGVTASAGPVILGGRGVFQGLVGLMESATWLEGVVPLLRRLESFPHTAVGALVLAAPVFLYFQFFIQPLWERWDRRERNAALFKAAQGPSASQLELGDDD